MKSEPQTPERVFSRAPRTGTRQIVLLLLLLLSASALRGYAQDPNTLRHVLRAPAGGPQAGAQLGFSVAIDGTLSVAGAPYDDIGAMDAGVVKVFDIQTGALLHVLINPYPEANDRFGWSVSISGTRIVVGCPFDDSTGIDSGTVFVYDLANPQPSTPIAVISNPDPTEDDHFGWAVAISGRRFVVGAEFGEGGTDNSGCAYAYELTGGNVVRRATFNNPSPAPDDRFGAAVAISGTRVVVGAPLDDTGATNTGSAYIFDTDSGTTPLPIVSLNNPEPRGGDEFGCAVAVHALQVAVGAEKCDNQQPDSGRVYVYDLGSGAASAPRLTLTSLNVQAARFGHHVAISGTHIAAGGPGFASSRRVYSLSGVLFGGPEVRGSSVALSGTRMVIGEPLSSRGAQNAGSAHVYEITAWPEPIVELNNPGPNFWDEFGKAVAVSGTRMVVGAPLDDTGAVDAGSAYLYDLASATPDVPVAMLGNPSPRAYANFGASVAISGDVVVVGVPNDLYGSACVYWVQSPSWPMILSDSRTPYDGFGASVAISGDWVVVGAPNSEAWVGAAGRVYVYRTGNTLPSRMFSGSNVWDEFGYSVGVSGNRVVVGARGDDTGATDAGSVYVFDLATGTQLTLSNPSAAPWDEFGCSVAINGTRLVVGARGDDTGAPDAGSAYIYDLANSSPTVPLATLNNPSPQEWEEFGSSVAISDAWVLVGVPGDNGNLSGAGSAYLYSSWGSLAGFLPNPSPALDDGFGFSVAISGSVAVIGAPFDDSALLPNKGIGYVFAPAAPPQLSVEQPAGSRLVVGQSSVHFGEAALSEGTTRAFLIHNTGVSDLTGLSAAVAGGNASCFACGSLAGTTLAPGASATLMVTFAPAVAGLRTTTLRIESNDPIVSSFEVNLAGEAITPIAAWRSTFFGTKLDAGAAAINANPDADGTVNLLEFAFGTNPTLADSGEIALSAGTIVRRGLPGILAGADKHAVFPRRKNFITAGLTYLVQWSADLTSWESNTMSGEVIASDSEIEMVSVPFPLSLSTGEQPRFFRVRVSLQ